MPVQTKKILAISGSLRSQSSNTTILKVIGAFIPEPFTYSIYDRLGDLPHFNPTYDHEDVHEAVLDLRAELAGADAVIICTPEYAFGVPGVLKNAIDWTVSSDHFGKKPVAVITASSQGAKAHASLLLILGAVQAHIIENATLLISFVRTKINEEGKVTDAGTLNQIRAVADAVVSFLSKDD